VKLVVDTIVDPRAKTLRRLCASELHPSQSLAGQFVVFVRVLIVFEAYKPRKGPGEPKTQLVAEVG